MFEGLTVSASGSAPLAKQGEGKSRLATYVLNRFRVNSDFRISSGAEERLIQATRAYNLIPSQSERRMFERMGVLPETFDPIVRARVNHIVALLTRVFVNQGKTWSVEETPVPEVPESVTATIYAKIFEEFVQLMQVTQQPFTPDAATEYAFKRSGDVFNAQKAWAAQRAKRMDRLIDDMLTEGKFDEVLREVIFNVCKVGTAVIIGPCETVEEGIRQTTGEALGMVKFEEKLLRRMAFFCPDTLDVFPSPGAKRDTDGDLCVRVRYSLPALDLYSRRSFAPGERKNARTPDGWDAAAVRRVIRPIKEGGQMPYLPLPIDTLIEEASTDNTSQSRKLCAEGVRYFGSLSGDMLASSGVTEDGNGKALDKTRWYEADVTVIDGEVVCARVCDPAVGRPVSKCVCYADPSSWFGGSFAFMLRNVQALMNVVMASMKTQMQMAAGPVYIFNDYENFVGAENPETFKIMPWKQLFQKVNPYSQGAGKKSVETLEFQTRLNEMLKVIEAVNIMADDLLGFPRHMFGMGSASGAVRTARGMAMMQEAANIVASWVIGNIDGQIIRPRIEKLVKWINMRYPDPSVKGDVSIVARGALGQVLETAKRDEAQNLYALVSRDAVLQQTLGPSKVLKLFRNMLEAMGVTDPDSYVPSAERIEEQEMLNRIGQMQRAIPPEQAVGQAPTSGDGAMDFQTGGAGQPTGVTPTGLPSMSGTEVASPEIGMTDTSDVKRRRGAA